MARSAELGQILGRVARGSTSSGRRRGQDVGAEPLVRAPDGRRVAAIADDEGFGIRADKTRIMPAHHHQRVTGLVVNDGPAVSRRDYDALRALLHNCARTGPDAQNHDRHPAFREHLLGRIAWAATGRPRRRERLRELFDRIDFDA